MQEIISRFPKNYFIERSVIATIQNNIDGIVLQNEMSDDIWDLTSFRPDILSNKKFVKQLEKSVKVTVLYENLTMLGKNVEIPRYIIWNNYIFINVR